MSAQIQQEQERDFWLARTTIERFLVKCETGMQTVDDVKDATEALKVLGIEIQLN